MEDLFEREQAMLEYALFQLEGMESSGFCPATEYKRLVQEYRRLLKQLRRITKISDKTAVDLNTSMLDLQDKVHFDELTGIYNRRFLDESLRRIYSALVRRNGTLSVLMIDIDFFKLFNDTYGHGQGDDCLRTVAQTVKDNTLYGENFTARYGGEEFVTVLPDMDETGARILADRILESIRACGIPHEKNEVANCVTVSIGITTGEVEAAHTAEEYIKIADKALYLSKQNGRNRSTFIHLQGER